MGKISSTPIITTLIKTVIKPMIIIKTKNNYCNNSYIFSSSLLLLIKKILTSNVCHSDKDCKNLSFSQQKDLLKLTLSHNNKNYKNNKNSYNSVKSLLQFLSHLNVL